MAAHRWLATQPFAWRDVVDVYSPAPFLDEPAHVNKGAIMRRACCCCSATSVTTDHISPAGAIPVESAAGRYLLQQGVAQRDFNQYSTRRGNFESDASGTFSNPRLRNELCPVGIQCAQPCSPAGRSFPSIKRSSGIVARGRSLSWWQVATTAVVPAATGRQKGLRSRECAPSSRRALSAFIAPTW